MTFELTMSRRQQNESHGGEILLEGITMSKNQGEVKGLGAGGRKCQCDERGGVEGMRDRYSFLPGRGWQLQL